MDLLQTIEGGSSASIAASIEHGVSDGTLPPGRRLPPIRDLAAALDLAPGTVARAYRDLRDRGVIETDGRRGSTIRATSVLLPRRTVMPVPEGAIDLGNGDPRLQPDPTAALASAARVATGYERPGAPVVLPELVDVLGAAARDDGVAVGRCAMVTGTMYGLELALQAHLRPGDGVAVEDPGWSDHADLFSSMGLRLVPVAIDEQGMRPDALAAVLDDVRAVVLTPRAQSPTGAAMDRARRDHLARLLAGRDVVVAEDDHAADIAGVELHAVASDPVTDHWVMVRSVSKAWGPDLRLAAVFGDDETVGRVRGRLHLSPGWVSRWLQAACLHLMTTPESRDQVAAARDLIARRRRVTIEALGDHGIRAVGTSGVNVWVPLHHDEASVVAGLLVRGWVVAPGERFRLVSPPGIRLTVSSLEEDDATRLARDLAAVLDHQAPAHA